MDWSVIVGAGGMAGTNSKMEVPILHNPSSSSASPSFLSARKVNVSNVDSAIFEAEMKCAKRQKIAFPWEKGVMGAIFGKKGVFPSSEPASVEMPHDQLQMPCSNEGKSQDTNAQQSGPAYLSSVKLRASWRSGQNDDKRDEALRKWRIIFLHNINACRLSSELHIMFDDESQMNLLNQVFAGKSTATLTKRANTLLRYLQFFKGLGEQEPFLPLDCELLYKYLQHLRDAQKFSAIRDMMQCVSFCYHVAGMPALDVAEFPWIKGITRDSFMHRKALRQSRTLTVREVVALENFVIADTGHPMDRFAAGVFLFMLYSRARSSDIRNLDAAKIDVGPVDSRHGYFEFETQDHKNARITRAMGIPLILVASLYGLADKNWALKFVELGESFGLLFGKAFTGPLLPGVSSSGALMKRPVSSQEKTVWLNNILKRITVDPKPGLTSHGLKATCLAWASKAGLSEEDRRILGNHAMSGKKSMTVYSRDIISAPLRWLEGVLSDIRHGNFLPDASRSGMIRHPLEGKTQPQVLARPVLQVKVSDSESEIKDAEVDPAQMEPELVTEVLDDGDSGPNSPDLGEVPPIWPETDSSSSSSTSSSDSDTSSQCQDVDDLVKDSVAVWALPKLVWKPECDTYRHKRTRTLHLRAKGSVKSTFVCGRKFTNDYEEFSGSIFAGSSKCKQCDTGKPLRDQGALATFLKEQRLQSSNADWS